MWLVLSSTELCGRSCVGDYCKIHLVRFRKGGGTKPCLVCGKGVINRFSLCEAHGYKNEYNKAWQKQKVARKAIFNSECRRLAQIDIS